MCTLAHIAADLPRYLTTARTTLQGTRRLCRREPIAVAPQPPRRPVFHIGQLLAGAYDIRGLLGSGGMGQVFDAHDRLLNRAVAIKAAWPHVGPEALRREAQVLAAFRHPGLVTAHAFAREGDTDFLVMERLGGAPLSQALRGGPLPLGEALAILRAIAGTLSVLHASGLAHADLKPSNVMLAPGGRVVLLDFGIVRIEQLRGDERLISGSPHYMAPETIRGAVRPGAAHLVDLYALGALAFTMLAGRPPFDDPDAVELMILHLTEPAPRLTGVPAPLEQLVGQMLAKAPDDRPASIDEVCAALDRC